MTPDAWTYCRLNLGTELPSPPFVWVCDETIYRGGFIFDITAVAMTKLFYSILGNASIGKCIGTVSLTCVAIGSDHSRACWLFSTCHSHILNVNLCKM